MKSIFQYMDKHFTCDERNTEAFYEDFFQAMKKRIIAEMEITGETEHGDIIDGFLYDSTIVEDEA